MLFSVCSRIKLFLVLTFCGLAVASGETARPPNAFVYIISPKDGDTVTSPFRVQFGLSGMGVAPAGVDAPNTGHHHLLIDRAVRLIRYAAARMVPLRPEDRCDGLLQSSRPISQDTAV